MPSTLRALRSPVAITAVVLSASTGRTGGIVHAQDVPKRPYELAGDFSLAASQGNQQVTTIALGQRYSYKFAQWNFSQSAAALLRGDYNLTKKRTAYLSVSGLRNTPADLNSLVQEGLGLGYQFSDAERHPFSKTAYLEQTATFTPHFTTSDAWLFTARSAVVAPLSARFGVKVDYLVNVNNAPPLLPPVYDMVQTVRFKTFDGLLTTGVGFTY